MKKRFDDFPREMGDFWDRELTEPTAEEKLLRLLLGDRMYERCMELAGADGEDVFGNEEDFGGSDGDGFDTAWILMERDPGVGADPLWNDDWENPAGRYAERLRAESEAESAVPLIEAETAGVEDLLEESLCEADPWNLLRGTAPYDFLIPGRKIH